MTQKMSEHVKMSRRFSLPKRHEVPGYVELEWVRAEKTNENSRK